MADISYIYPVTTLNILMKTALFDGLTQDQLDQLANLAQSVRFEVDEMLNEQGHYAEFLYILLSGEVHIRFKPPDGEMITVAKVTEGGVCGWSAVLGRAIYTSAGICVKPCEALRLRGRELQKLCETHPDTGVIIMERLAEVIAERLTNTNEQIMSMLSHNLNRNKKQEAG